MYFLPEHHTDFVFTVSSSAVDFLMLIAVVFLAALITPRYRTFLIALGLSALALAAGGVGFLLFGQNGLLILYPIIKNVIPWIGYAVVLGTGVLLGVLARMAFQRLRGDANRRH
jgi:cell division protein FtsW (lipid II flippase)